MANQAPSQLAKRLEAEIRQILRATDTRSLPSKERKVLNELMQNLIDCQIYSHSYELSETRQEQLDNAKTARKWLNQARENILIASESNIFSAIDVAHLAAKIEQMSQDLK